MAGRRIVLILSAVLVLGIVGSGCYTIIKHPQVDDSYQADSDYRQQCLSCHADYGEFPYGFYYESTPGYWWHDTRWGKYYAYPWWWEHYWWDDKDKNPAVVPAEGEKVDRRRGLEPPYVTDQPLAPLPVTPGGIGGSGNTGGTTTGSGEVKGDQGKPKTDEKKQEKAERRRKPKG